LVSFDFKNFRHLEIRPMVAVCLWSPHLIQNKIVFIFNFENLHQSGISERIRINDRYGTSTGPRACAEMAGMLDFCHLWLSGSIGFADNSHG